MSGTHAYGIYVDGVCLVILLSKMDARIMADSLRLVSSQVIEVHRIERVLTWIPVEEPTTPHVITTR